MSKNETLGNPTQTASQESPSPISFFQRLPELNAEDALSAIREFTSTILPPGSPVDLFVCYPTRSSFDEQEGDVVSKIPFEDVVFRQIKITYESENVSYWSGVFAFPNGEEFSIPANMIEVTPAPKNQNGTS